MTALVGCVCDGCDVMGQPLEEIDPVDVFTQHTIHTICIINDRLSARLSFVGFLLRPLNPRHTWFVSPIWLVNNTVDGMNKLEAKPREVADIRM